jgi:UDP-N-acetylglucosamine 2-epimerase
VPFRAREIFAQASDYFNEQAISRWTLNRSASRPGRGVSTKPNYRMKTLFVMGTRPEAVKLCPVIRHFRSCGKPGSVEVCVSGQHRSMLDQVLEVFAVRPDYDLDLMLPGQTLFQSTSRILAGLESVLQHSRPDLVMVQGDTTTTLAGALAAAYARVPVGHIEAGLRTGDMSAPFPEEMNRTVVARLALLPRLKTFLLRESILLRLWSLEIPGLKRRSQCATALHRGGSSHLHALFWTRLENWFWSPVIDEKASVEDSARFAADLHVWRKERMFRSSIPYIATQK